MTCLWASSAQAVQTHTSPPPSAPPLQSLRDGRRQLRQRLFRRRLPGDPPGAPPKVIKFDSEGHELGKIDNANFAACPGAKNFNNPFGVAVELDQRRGLRLGPEHRNDQRIRPDRDLPLPDPRDRPVGRRHRRSIPLEGPNGTLYVSANNNHTIESFDAATGAPISSFGSGPGYVLSLAVDSSGNDLRRQLQRKSRRVRTQRRMRQRMRTDRLQPIPDGHDRPGQQPHSRVRQRPDLRVRARCGPTRRSPSARAHLLRLLVFGAAVNATSGRFYVSDFYAATVDIFDPGPICRESRPKRRSTRADIGNPDRARRP